MLPFAHKIAFLLFAAVTLAIGLRGFYRVYRRIRARQPGLRCALRSSSAKVVVCAGYHPDAEPHLPPAPGDQLLSFLHLLWVRLLHPGEPGGWHRGIHSLYHSIGQLAGLLYNLLADLLSALVLIGVVALVIRRFLLPSRRDFTLQSANHAAPGCEARPHSLSTRLSSRPSFSSTSAAARWAQAPSLRRKGRTAFSRSRPCSRTPSPPAMPKPGASLATGVRWAACWLFLMYFPFSKHIHIFAAPAKYLVARRPASGVLPAQELDLESENLKAGANKLEDLAWPRLLDAYACIQCNRCQDVCPATATGKALSPSALEINKRMELNARERQPGFEPEKQARARCFSFALSPEAAWACTTCGACMEVCPVQDEPMLDIIDIRRNQVMIQGEFPAQLQTAFRGMERTRIPGASITTSAWIGQRARA